VGGVFSFGGHGDLDTVMHYLSTGALPRGGTLPPHLYGQAVLLRRLADRLVPADQAEALRAALFLFLKEKPEAFQAAVSQLPPESRRLAELCLHWDAKGVGEVLKPFADQLRCDPALSPMRGPVPDCPVFLLHGSVDNVIPPSETEALAAWAAPRTPTRALVTDLIRHVELEDKGERKSALLESYRLMRFMTALLRA
jgi:pimeloyl-ACP methyl ester carboxylesterase